MTTREQSLQRGAGWPLAGPAAWTLAFSAIAIVFFSTVLTLYAVFSTGDTRQLLSHQTLTPFITIGFSLLGALVASRRPGNFLGWLFLTTGLLSAINSLAVAVSLAAQPLLGDASRPWWLELAAWLGVWVWIPLIFLPTIFVFLYFPDGKLPSHRWRPLAWVAGLGLAAAIVGLALHPGPVESWGTGTNPLGIQAAGPVLDPILNASQLLVTVAFFGSLVAVAVRFRASRGQARAQMKWLLYAAALAIVGLIGSGVAFYVWPASALAGELTIAFSSLGVLGIVAAAAVAILRHRLYDIDLIISRTLVYGGLTAIITGLYVLSIGVTGLILGADGNAVGVMLTAIMVAAFFQPLRERLQHAVNRLIYGERDDPLETLTQLGRQLESTIAPDEVLPSLVETIARTLKLPYVAITLNAEEGQEVAADYGRPEAQPMSFPLVYQGQRLGFLQVAPRGPKEAFDPAEIRLLRNVARQAGPSLRAVQLTADLQHSRERLVTAREEERRRLRRDLHDGLGSALAAMNLQMGVLSRLIKKEPEAAEQMAAEVKGEIRGLIDDIRRLVYELRPPALDELGLAAAVRGLADRYSNSPSGADGPTLQISVEAAEELPPLPAAVEVAAYRIIQEALANVVHHAGAQHCSIRLSLDAELNVEVEDDGVGLPADLNGGLGHLSMRERAAELGGSCVIEPGPQRGTRVRARLPLLEES